MANVTEKLNKVVKGRGVTYTTYPVVGAGVGAGTAVATFAGANAFTAADVVLMAAGTVTAIEFWFCSATVTASTATAVLVVDIRTSTPTSIFPFRCNPTAATPNIPAFHPPYPIWVLGTLGIGARSGSTAGTQTCSLSILIATGL
jgi:hypothetical protein